MDDIHVIDFEAVYKPQPDGTIKEIHIVRYCAKGSRQYAINEETVTNLAKVMPLEGNEDNPAVVMANHRWDAIRPKYESWKAGNEIPENGTPLGAWPAINQKVAEMIKSHGIRTVEEFAEGSDSFLARLNVPNARELKNLAINYLDSRDGVKVANQMKEKDEQLEHLGKELEEMRALIADMAKEKPKSTRSKKASA